MRGAQEKMLRKSKWGRGRWGVGGEPGKKKPCSSPAGEVLPVLLALAGTVLLRSAGLHQRLLRAVGAEQRVLLRLLVLLQAAARLLAKPCKKEAQRRWISEGQSHDCRPISLEGSVLWFRFLSYHLLTLGGG